MQYKKILGAQGEQHICDYLKKRGYSIVALNYSSRLGEIDVIAHKNSILACVEVKTRSATYFATSTVITKSKQEKIIKTAKFFLQQNPSFSVACRFDVAIIIKKNENLTIEYIENAFYGE